MDSNNKFILAVLIIFAVTFLGGIAAAVLDDIYAKKPCVQESK